VQSSSISGRQINSKKVPNRKISGANMLRSLEIDDEENFLPATKYQEAEIKKSCNKNKLV
jgi:hypothetical protein